MDVGDNATGPGWIARYRHEYSKLPPSLQLIGLQLWLPLFFIVAFCFCYILAFHSPKVQHAPIAVVSTSPSTVSDLTAATGTTFDYTAIPTVRQAKEDVKNGDYVAALNMTDPAKPVLLVASAHQFQAVSIAKTALTPVATASGHQLAVEDLAPLPAHDSFGMVTMYLMLSWCIGGYMVAMFIGMMGAPLLHRTRVAVIVGGSIVIGLVANFLAGPVIGAVAGHFVPLVFIAMGWIIAIGLAVNGLSYFFGRFITAPAILLFVFLSIPASGAAYPVWMLPKFFGWLHPGVVGFGMTEMIKRTLFGVGEPYWKGILLMACYAVAGLLLMFVGKPWRQRREVNRILAGHTTMMAEAQGAMREHGIATRERVLAHYGVDPHQTAVALTDELESVGDPTLQGYQAEVREDD